MKILLKTILFLSAFALAGLAVANELGKADALYDKGKYKEALAIYMKHQDDSTAQNNIGMIYLQPGMHNEKESTAWFRKAADQGNAQGLYNLGMAYQEGISVKKDNAKAFQFFKQSADKDLPAAMNALGIMYRNGWGIKTDEKEALNWYLKAANAGNNMGVCNAAGIFMHGKTVRTDYKQAHAMLDGCIRNEPNNDCCLDRMAEIYSGGLGVKQDAKKAHALREKAAASGSGVAMYMLGRDFDYGIGVSKDPKQAIDWYTKAAAKNEAMAMHRLYEVYEHGKLGQPVDKVKAAEWKARAEKAMKDQGVSRNAWVDAFRLLMED